MSRDDADAASMGFRSSGEVSDWQRAQGKRQSEGAELTPSGLPQPQTVEEELAAMLARYIEHYDAKPSIEYIRLRRDEAARILDALSAPAVETVAVQEAPEEIVGWEYRHLDTANTPNRWSEWERCKARNPHTSTDKDYADEIQAYIDMGYKYELRTLYTRPPLPVAPKAEPVAEVISFTNGSYSRNYKVRFLRDVPEGTKLYAAHPHEAAPQPVALSTLTALQQAEEWIADVGRRPGMRAVADAFLDSVIRPALAAAPVSVDGKEGQHG